MGRRQSQKEELASLREALRGQGWTYSQVALRPCQGRPASRLSHNGAVGMQFETDPQPE